MIVKPILLSFDSNISKYILSNELRQKTVWSTLYFIMPSDQLFAHLASTCNCYHICIPFVKGKLYIKTYTGYREWMYLASCTCMIHLSKQDHQHNHQLRRTKTPKASLWTSKVNTWYNKRYLYSSMLNLNKKKMYPVIWNHDKRKNI